MSGAGASVARWAHRNPHQLSRSRRRSQASGSPAIRRHARSLAASQARLNEIVAPIIRGASVDRDLIARALDALREHNWASGFAFEGRVGPRMAALASQRHCDTRDTRDRAQKEADAARARAVAYTYDHVLPPDAAALTRRLKADAPALVYVITHAALGAVKIGVSDAPGSRVAEHRRGQAGSFSRHSRSPPMRPARSRTMCSGGGATISACRRTSNVSRCPRGGWTETAAAAAVDLAATMAHVCELALSPDARPAG